MLKSLLKDAVYKTNWTLLLSISDKYFNIILSQMMILTYIYSTHGWNARVHMYAFLTIYTLLGQIEAPQSFSRSGWKKTDTVSVFTGVFNSRLWQLCYLFRSHMFSQDRLFPMKVTKVCLDSIHVAKCVRPYVCGCVQRKIAMAGVFIIETML